MLLCQIVVEAAERWGGTVDKFIGDEALLFFGDPEPLADHAHRAIQCALELQDRFDALRRSGALDALPPTGLKVGIHTGPIIVGTFGGGKRMDYSVFGHSVNVGARLCARGPEGGGTTISDVTRERAETNRETGPTLPGARAYVLLPRDPVVWREEDPVEVWDVEAVPAV